jgi:hypothetical protein
MRTNDHPGADLVGELVLGKRSPEDPQVRAAFRADPDLERRWKELSRTAELLEAARDFEAAMLAEVRAEGASNPVAEENVGRILREEARRPRANWRHWTLAVAAGLLLIAWISFGGRDEPQGKAYLGGHGGTGGAPTLLEPVGSLDSGALPTFRWTFAPEAAWEGHCVVVLYDASGSELLRSPEIREPSDGSTWEWRPAAPAEWLDPARTPTFFWQVSSVSNLGEVASSAPQEVRSSPSPR